MRLPLVRVLTPAILGTSHLRDVGHAHKESIMDLVDTHGAVLLRGAVCGPDPASCFSEFAQSLRLAPFADTSESAAPRANVAPFVWTANEAPASAAIPFHHEMAQASVCPRYIAFFCERPSSRGGRTPLVRSRDIAAELRRDWPRCADEMDRRRVRYVRTLPCEDDDTSPIGKSWRTAFQTDSREACERTLRARGIKCTWQADGSLTTLSPACRVFGTDAIGRETFFNSIVAAQAGWKDRRNVKTDAVIYADGEPLTMECRALLNHTARRMEASAVRLQWQRGDVIILDNLQVLHAREPFPDEPTPRRVLASLWGER